MIEWLPNENDFHDDWGVGGLGVCECEPDQTGRCWLQVDQDDFERNLAILKRGGKLSQTAFAQEEAARLGRKAHEMALRKIDRLDHQTYCAGGGCFQSERERAQCVVGWINDQR